MKFLFLLAQFSIVASAQETVAYLEEYPLNDHYKSGRHLVYDCQRKHYACVNQDGNDNCRDRREKSIALNAQEYDCAPLKDFKDKKDCILKNYEVVEMNAWKRFCFPK